MKPDLWLGLDIGGTKVAAVLATDAGEIVARWSAPTDPGGGPGTIEGILAAGEAVLERAGVSPGEVAAIGIGAPGDVDREPGLWSGSTNLVLASPAVPLVALVRERFGRPTFIENDVKAGALGELHFGAHGGAGDLVYLSVGTGIAAGVVVGGALYRGAGWAGEIGHAPVDPRGPDCRCGGRGCLEVMASGASIGRRGRAAVQGQRDTEIARLCGGDAAAVTARLVFAAAARQDPVALEIVAEAAAYLAMGVIVAFRAYDPQALVLGGGVVQAGEVFLDPLRGAVRQQARLRGASYLERMSATELGADAGALGAVAVARQGALPGQC